MPNLPWEGRMSLPPGVNVSHNPAVMRRRGKDGTVRECLATVKSSEQRHWDAGAHADLFEQGIPRVAHGTPLAVLFDVVMPTGRQDVDNVLKGAIDALADPNYGLARPDPAAPARLVQHRDGRTSLKEPARWNDRFIYTLLARKCVVPAAQGHIVATVGANQPALFDIVRALLRRPALLEVVRAVLRAHGEDI